MKFKKQRDEEERLERAAKIRAHLNKGTSAETQPGAATDQPADASKAPAPTPTRIWPPLQPWEKIGAFGRREQFRPMTRAEAEAVNEQHFLASQFKQDQAHAKKVAAAEQDAKAEAKATKKRAEHEARTGRRPYESGRYVSLEEARRRGYLNGSSSGEGSSGNSGLPEWSSPGNPSGIMGGGR